VLIACQASEGGLSDRAQSQDLGGSAKRSLLRVFIDASGVQTATTPSRSYISFPLKILLGDLLGDV
jgi:hypothetical protein